MALIHQGTLARRGNSDQNLIFEQLNISIESVSIPNIASLVATTSSLGGRTLRYSPLVHSVLQNPFTAHDSGQH